MTTETPDDRHLSEEELSDRLDRAVGADAGAGATDGTFVTGSDSHLAACARCRGQLAALERARAALRVPVPAVEPSVRAAAIATALASVPVEGDVGSVPSERPTPPVPISVGRRRWVQAVGAAAVVAVLAAGLTVTALHGGSSGHRSTASGAAHSSASGRASAASAPVPFKLTFGPAGEQSDQLQQNGTPSARALGDLGPITSAADLRGVLASNLASAAPAPQSAATTPATPSTAATSAPGQAASTPSVTPNSESVYGAVAPGDGHALELCVAAAYNAVRSAGTVGAVEELATARYRGTAALVYIIAGSGPGPDHVVAVARGTCRVLVTTSL